MSATVTRSAKGSHRNIVEFLGQVAVNNIIPHGRWAWFLASNPVCPAGTSGS